MAIGQHGAVGIVSDMPNQTTAWSGLDPTLIRWGHLDARQPSGFAFMVSRQAAEALRARLASGEPITLNAHVKAEVGPGHWTVVTATIPGSDLSSGEIVYSCHLDHERPGANDNGSGCVTILESARMLARLIKSGALPPPKRTLRFVWGPEIEGTMAFLASPSGNQKKLRANIHMDMVGGDPFKNKAIFHVTGTPWSLPSFVTDVGVSFLNTIKTAASDYAAGGDSPNDGIVETRAGAQGTRNEPSPTSRPTPKAAIMTTMTLPPSLSPHSTFAIGRTFYIHTDHDSLAQIDPTKLRRVALLGAASGYAYASIDSKLLPQALPYLAAQSHIRLESGFRSRSTTRRRCPTRRQLCVVRSTQSDEPCARSRTGGAAIDDGTRRSARVCFRQSG